MPSYGHSPYSSSSHAGYSQPLSTPPSTPSSLETPKRSTQPLSGKREVSAQDKEEPSHEESPKGHEPKQKREHAFEEGPISGKRSGGSKGQQKSEPKEEKKEKEAVAKFIARLENNFDDIDQLYEQHAILSEVKNTLLGSEELDTQFIEEGLKTIIAKMKNAKKIVGDIAQEIKGYTLEDKTRIKTNIEKILQKQDERIGKTSKEIKDIEDNKTTLTIEPKKRFFYLGDESQKEAVVQATPEEFHPFVDIQVAKIHNNTALTLFSLAQAWKELNDTFKADFSTLLPRRRRR